MHRIGTPLKSRAHHYFCQPWADFESWAKGEGLRWNIDSPSPNKQKVYILYTPASLYGVMSEWSKEID